ncbi:PH domain-containing protein [Sphingomonas sp. R1]|uniref:PH domain-containing protein n=1 Tax=Sphingomonas sp. R1 TaxID=399176 RepID=UPI00222469CE|nr:PH domain-containing protein [Sphingomonas sp. R1]UYY77106.1 PH domain-containing protein [Sphingomonas sp. R1]
MAQLIDRFQSSTAGWIKGSFAGWATVVSCLVGVGFVILAIRWIGNKSTLYEVTEDRIVLYRGIVRKSIDEIELYRVKDVRLDYSIFNQISGIGTLTITSSDETTRGGPLVIRDVAYARERREKLRELVSNARRLRGVREIDMVQEDLRG